jgi:hypothetical protein
MNKMPLPMVHLSVAKNIIDSGFAMKDLSSFYLGVISPDAIHMRQNADRYAKNRTHLIPSGKKWNDVDECEYFKFLLSFVQSNKDDGNLSFLWGYSIHILTDMLWTKNLYYSFVTKYKEDTAPIQDERWAYYNDTDILDQVLFNESPWRENVWKYLQKAKAFDFMELLSANEINSWNERTLHWYDSGESQHKNPIRYITKSDEISFISYCSEMILSYINRT